MTRRTIVALGATAMLLLTTAPAMAAGGSGGAGGGTGGGSATGAGSATGGGAGGGGKVTCTNSLTVTATASEALTGNSFTAAYTSVTCQSKNRVQMTATDLATGAVVWMSVPDLAGSVAIWTLPYRLTSYRIDARLYSGSNSTLAATASTTVATLDVIPCDVMVNETATVGYWGIYAAVWAATDARDCGIPGLSVHLRITDLTTGAVSIDYPNLPLSSMIDFEGGIVAYANPYRVEADLHNSVGEVLASSTTDVVSAPLR
jgi:hypothetical protein